MNLSLAPQTQYFVRHRLAPGGLLWPVLAPLNVQREIQLHHDWFFARMDVVPVVSIKRELQAIAYHLLTPKLKRLVHLFARRSVNVNPNMSCRPSGRVVETAWLTR